QLKESVNYKYDDYKNKQELAHINRIRVNINESDYIKSFIDKDANEGSHEKFNENKENNLKELRNNEFGNKHLDIGELDFFNGYGGFNKTSNSYIIRLTDYENTPAPWINVISNKDFGFHISEVGSTYTWCGNSRENKITPWSNDWVIDPTGEALYIRDNNTGAYFTITPMPIRDGGEYIIEHSFGLSTFKHTAYNISGEMKIFCPQEEKLKLCKVSLKNLSNVDKSLSIFY
ncbi:hypothetical protein GNF51_14185, partial [Clostridium perfringens]|uniref:hypothetical protein n=1 Tax=Clostridium perfringens TaxID=1502 RepID=UPI002AC51EAE